MKLFKSEILFIVLFSFNLFAQTESNALLKKLSDGNTRFVTSHMIHPNISDIRRTEVAQGQKPFAVILTCSDSRVPPEIIFDQGLGDLFVIRTAGEVVDDIAIASIEYAIEHLGVKLIVVMGHQKCGAVDAAVKGGKFTLHIDQLVEEIMPAVKKAK
jgi:carbonic anhydrase